MHIYIFVYNRFCVMEMDANGHGCVLYCTDAVIIFYAHNGRCHKCRVVLLFFSISIVNIDTLHPLNVKDNLINNNKESYKIKSLFTPGPTLLLLRRTCIVYSECPGCILTTRTLPMNINNIFLTYPKGI